MPTAPATTRSVPTNTSRRRVDGDMGGAPVPGMSAHSGEPPSVRTRVESASETRPLTRLGSPLMLLPRVIDWGAAVLIRRDDHVVEVRLGPGLVAPDVGNVSV